MDTPETSLPNKIHHQKKGSKIIISFLLIVAVILSIWEIRIFLKAQHQAEIGQEITKTIHNSYLTVGVATIDLNDNTQKTFGTTKAFNGASTTKIILAACVLSLVEKGKLNVNDQLGSFPMSFQLMQMVNQSNNDAWDLLTERVGLSTLKTYAKTIGISYNTDSNTIAPLNEALFLQKLYNGLLLSPKDTQLLLSYMQHTNDEDFIPSSVPSGTTVYHKYGWLNGDVHDAAVLVYKGHPTIVTIYTSSSQQNSYPEQVLLIRKLAKLLFAYQYNT